MKLSPKDQFTPDKQSVAYILQQYGLELVAFHEASSGIENRTLIVDTNGGKYVLRIYRQGRKANAAIELELHFAQYLHEGGIRTPTVITNQAGEQITIQQVDGKTWQSIVMEFAQGEHATVYTEHLLQDLATIQATMHTLSSQYSEPTLAASSVTVLRGGNLSPTIPFEVQDEQVYTFLRRAQDYAVALPPTLARGLCHLDFDKDNTLVKDGDVSAILDFDDLAVAPFVVCLAYTLWNVYVEADQDAVQKYLTHYEKVRELSDVERRYIPLAMLYRHYLISMIKIQNGHTSPAEISRFIKIERNLRHFTVE